MEFVILLLIIVVALVGYIISQNLGDIADNIGEVRESLDHIAEAVVRLNDCQEPEDNHGCMSDDKWDCIACANGNDLPEGEICQVCSRIGQILHST